MEYAILPNGTEVIAYVYCYPPKNIHAGGLWRVSAPLYQFALPVALWQMVLVWCVSRTLAFLLKPFRQPRVIAEILTGILLGPTVLSRIKLNDDEGGPDNLGELLVPKQSFRQIDFFGHLGVLSFLFLVGVEFDIRMITKMRKKVVFVAVANTFLPFIFVVIIVLAMDIKAPSSIYHPTHVVFVGLAMVVTAFPVLIRLLSELKLLNDEVGQTVLPSAVLTDLMAWALLTMTLVLPTYSNDAMAKALSTAREPMRFASVWIILCGIGFVLICWLVFRPIMFWMVRRTPAGHPVSDVFILIIVTSLLAVELVSDTIGLHAVFGAFIFGLMVPQGPLSVGLREKLEEFVVNILLPLFFASTGFKTNLSNISLETEEDEKILLGFVIMSLVCVAVKVGSSMLIAQYYSLPASHGLSVGLLMSAKGPIEMIILNIGKQKHVFDGRTYAILMLQSVLTTSAIAPAVAILNRATRSRFSYKRRNLERSRPDKELRMVACVHTFRNVPSLISFLQLSNPTKRSPMFVYAVHLMELATRATAMRIVHETGVSKREGRRAGASSGTAMRFEQSIYISALGSYEQHAGAGVSVQLLTALSPYSTMHEDIVKIAEERYATLVILPFHKQKSVTTGEFEEINPFIRGVNQSVLSNPPCSIGILVDRGLSRSSRFPSSQQVPQNVAVLFFGGPDDREALSYSWRMADNSGINLTVVRFILKKEKETSTRSSASSPFTLTLEERAMMAIEEDGMQQLLDDESVNRFRVRFISDENVTYTEKIVGNAVDTVEAIHAMNDGHTMYVVGKGKGMESSPLLRGLMEWAEYPELGPIGDLLVSSDFGDRPASVLVMQQYSDT